jgi:excisionase family DNA binding protein
MKDNGMSVYKQSNGVPISKKILLSKEEAAEMVSISVSGIERLMKTNDIPFKRVGGLVRFHREELNHWALNIGKAGGGKNGK